MIRQITIALGATLVVLIGGFFIVGHNIERLINRVDPVPLPEISPQARQLHDSAIVVDLHADTLLFGRNLLKRASVGQVDLPRLREGGVGLQFFTIVSRVPMSRDIHKTSVDLPDVITVLGFAGGLGYGTRTPFERTLLQLDRLEEAIEGSAGGMMAIESRADLEALLKARSSNPSVVGALSGIEGAHALDADLKNLDVLFERGLRMVGLTHFFDNAVAGSAHGINKGGLTELGRDVVRRMDELGIVMDLAHLAPKAIDDVLAIIHSPTLVSHTGVKGTCDNPRNLSNRHLRKIAEGGGVIGIGYFDLAVCGTELSDIVAAMSHVRQTVGADHIALGSDYDGSITAGFDTSQLAAITQALLDAGFSSDEVRKVLGDNVIRVLRQVLPAT